MAAMSSTERELNVLVLQGGGALGSYQAGVFDALSRTDFSPDWVAGISIGAINAALIAGNPRERCVERLREFWDQASSSPLTPALFTSAEALRPWFSEFSAGCIAAFGVPGFFAPRFPPPLLQQPGTPAAVSYYDTAPLRQTLERLVDFDRINDGGVRLSLGATHVTTGDFCYFDSAYQRISPEHVMASGALPPGFPPVEIDGRLYWDGGLVSNTPLQYVLDQEKRRDLLVFQVDLFSARGEAPRTLMDVAEREKDIRFSSRTRLNTDLLLTVRRAKALVKELIAEAPERKDDPRVLELECLGQENGVTVVHLIFRPEHYNSSSKDYEFSRPTMLEHWAVGAADAERTLTHPKWIHRQRPEEGVSVFDLGGGGPDTAAEAPKPPTPAEERAPQSRDQARSRRRAPAARRERKPAPGVGAPPPYLP
jgi:NTE family protein